MEKLENYFLKNVFLGGKIAWEKINGKQVTGRFCEAGTMQVAEDCWGIMQTVGEGSKNGATVINLRRSRRAEGTS